jgi:hypothetical protein
MILFLVIAAAALAAAVAGLALSAKRTLGRLKAAEEERDALSAGVEKAAARLEALADLAARNKTIEEEADEKRRELDESSDGDLVNRANNLFGGVRDGAE